jgi:asparagine synthase (glutamine-hydrolysing)
MCGIVGLVEGNIKKSLAEKVLGRMAQAIVHRGPDAEGCWAVDGGGIAMRRLSVIDVEGGQQPISNEAGDIHIVCNGEIYNFRELREKLIGRGHVFKTRSDTEVALHLYEEEGVNCFHSLRGMFAIAIWDQRNRLVVIARDRLGKKPLFYSAQPSSFVFGSEIKSLIAAKPELAEVELGAIPQYLSAGYLLEPDTFYSKIKKLPAGHFAVIDNDRVEIKSFWSLQFQVDNQVDEGTWLERLDETLLEAVRIRLVSDVPLGVFLSGGVDSSIVAAYANRAGLKPLNTFTVGFDDSPWDESNDARRIAEHLGAKHHELRLSVKDLQKSLPQTLEQIVHFCDEPFGDDSALPTYHISRLAREHVTVILSGDGGDEFFGGYSSYHGMLFAERYRRLFPGWLGASGLPSIFRALSKVTRGGLRYRLQRAERVFRHSAMPLADGYREKCAIWGEADLQELLTPEAFRKDHAQQNALALQLEKILASDRDLISRLTEIDVRSYLKDDILVKVDRMSMAHSLEVRSPLLDHKLAELAASMPSSLKIRGGVGKYILKKVAAPFVPQGTFKKPKQGFGVPLRDWLRFGLSEMVGDYLEGSPSKLPGGMFQTAKVGKILAEHRSGQRDHSRKIWLLLVLAKWNEQRQITHGH